VQAASHEEIRAVLADVEELGLDMQRLGGEMEPP
jgi:hypothetical protein